MIGCKQHHQLRVEGGNARPRVGHLFNRCCRLRGSQLHFACQRVELFAQGLRDGHGGDKAVRTHHGDGGIVLREPAFQAVLRIAKADDAGYVVLIAMNLHLRHHLDKPHADGAPASYLLVVKPP